MTELSSRRCVPCEGGAPPLPEEEAQSLQSQLSPGWRRDGNRSLERDFRFDDFAGAFAFATRIALLAEQEGHHPDLDVRWGKVGVRLTTHAAGGLTDNDFIMASKIDLVAPQRSE